VSLVRCTAFFRDDDGHGWSESHDRDSGGTTPDITAILSQFDNLLNSNRVPLLCADSFYIGCRASFKTAQNQTAGDNLERDPPQRGPQTVGGVAITMTAPENSIKMRLRNAASTQHSDVYLRGFPKQLIDAAVLDTTSAIGAGWKAKADQYAAALVQLGYGWVGINSATTARGTVTGYMRQTDGTILFNLTPTNGVVLPAVGTKLTVKFARLNRSKSILNRSLVCRVLAGGATVQCEEVIAADDFETDGTFIATQLSFIPYSALSYYRLARRKTGRPFGVGPGRLKAQTLH
jgi:hypothetical protein